MTPTEAARRLYELYPQESTFEQDLAKYAAFGYVWASPECLIMARTCILGSEDEWLTGERLALADCWLVWCHVGPLSELFRVCPFPLPWVAFYRRGVRRVYRFDRIEKMC